MIVYSYPTKKRIFLFGFVFGLAVRSLIIVKFVFDIAVRILPKLSTIKTLYQKTILPLLSRITSLIAQIRGIRGQYKVIIYTPIDMSDLEWAAQD